MKNEEERINPGHTQVRGVLRVIGPLVALTGVTLIAIGMISFFSSFGSFEPPRYFWCCFLGMPVLWVGGVMSMGAYAGSVGRYMAAESAPVSKDTFNYLAQGTSPGIRTIAQAIGEGFATGAGGGERAVSCPRCSSANPADAQFCAHCGTAIGAPACPRCGTSNEPAARFCNQCGAQLV